MVILPSASPARLAAMIDRSRTTATEGQQPIVVWPLMAGGRRPAGDPRDYAGTATSSGPDCMTSSCDASIVHQKYAPASSRAAIGRNGALKDPVHWRR